MSLSLDRIRRAGGAAGILFIVLGIVALFLPGTPPKADEVEKITPFFVDNRGQILASNYLLGLAFLFFLLFLSSLRIQLGAGPRVAAADAGARAGITDAGPVRPGVAALVGGVVAAALTLAGAAVMNGAAFQVATDTELNRALYNVANDLFLIAGFAFAAFFIGSATAASLTGTLPAWMVPFGYLVALLNVVGPIAFFVKSGFFAIGGAFGFIVPLASLLWILGASVTLLRSPDATAGATPAAGARTPA